MTRRLAFPRVRDRLWGRAPFRRQWRRYEKLQKARDLRSGRGLMRRIRRFLRRFYMLLLGRKRR